MNSSDVTFPASGNVALEPGRFPTPKPIPPLLAALPDVREPELAIVCCPIDEVIAVRVELLTMVVKPLEKFLGIMIRASISRLLRRLFASSSLALLSWRRCAVLFSAVAFSSTRVKVVP